MMGLRLRLREDRMVGIPHPSEFADEAEVARWAVGESESFASAQQERPPEEFVAGFASVLQAAAASAGGSETAVALVADVESGFWSITRFAVQDAPLTQEEVDAFLLPAALLRPRVVGFEAEGLGQGLMSTFLRSEQGGAELVHVRWCFSNATGSVAVQTDPMPLAWLAPLFDSLVDLVMSALPQGLDVPPGTSFAQQQPNFVPPDEGGDAWEALLEETDTEEERS